jgi:hypothetical protein
MMRCRTSAQATGALGRLSAHVARNRDVHDDFFLVPLMALLLTYFEVWPERVIGAVFGDPSRLWQYDPEKDKRS